MSPVPRRQPSSSTCSTASPPPGAGPWRFLVLQPLPSGEFSCLFTSLYWILPNNFCCKVIREGGSILDHPVIVLFFLCCPCTDRKQISSVCFLTLHTESPVNIGWWGAGMLSVLIMWGASPWAAPQPWEVKIQYACVSCLRSGILPHCDTTNYAVQLQQHDLRKLWTV